jgi:hypothetical protein
MTGVNSRLKLIGDFKVESKVREAEGGGEAFKFNRNVSILSEEV